MNKKIAMLIVLLAIASTACATLKNQPSAVSGSNVTATFTQASTNTPEPTATETPTPDYGTSTPRNQNGGRKSPTSVPTNADAVQEGSIAVNGWDVHVYKGSTDQMLGWVEDLNPIVSGWSEFPNVDFPAQNFLSANGMEYGMAESAFCQQSQLCDVNVAAMHYRLISGDYEIAGIDQCSTGEEGFGCAIALFNVGTVSAMYRDSQVDYGFTVTGRYWNGDAMPITIWALASNTVYNMTESDTVNRGANCSIPEGCSGVRFTFVILSGNQMLVKGTSTVNTQ